MEITVNGNKVVLEKKVTVAELLVLQNVAMPEMVSVEINGEILERAQFESETIKSGDAIEFLYFMGGGACEL